MRYSEKWNDYKLLDTSDGMRLEKWGKYVLIRPDPQAIWQTPKENENWKRPNAVYHRSKSGGGNWEIYNLPSSWKIKYDDMVFNIKPMNFKHTGIFPEQAVNWDFMRDKVKNAGRPIKVLNLFAYTGGATVACAKAGASVCHVDASKGIVQMAKENAKINGLENHPIRYIVDDCLKFVMREYRRGNTYDAIIMDPPSYGRGPGGEVWQLEDKLFELVSECVKILSKDALFFVLNSYSTGLSASVMKYMLQTLINEKFGGQVIADEIGLKVYEKDLYFPSGSTAIWHK